MISGVVVLLAISVWYCMSYIPDQMKRAMNHFGDGAAPAFAFQAVSEGAVPTTATPGKILVIDFLARGALLASRSCRKSHLLGQAYKTDATLSLLSWQPILVETPRSVCDHSADDSTLHCPSLSMREEKHAPHSV
jgi:hypothetical protein